MPMRSKRQNRFFHWADEHPAEAKREHGLKPGVVKEFIASQHGKSLKGLPERVQHKAVGGAVKRPQTRW